jgi:sugar phosphate isomerase/epimerase
MDAHSENPFKEFEEVEWRERRELLQSEMAVAFSTKSKDGSLITLQEQIECFEAIGAKSVQFDFRNRMPHAQEAMGERLAAFRELHDDVAISLHGETPKIDETTLTISNADVIAKEIDIAKTVEAESFTVHPPAVRQELFDEATLEMRNKVIGEYASLFAEKIKVAIDEGKRFSIAIENMPAEGKDGAWGQTPQDIKFLIQKVEETLVKTYDVHPDVAHEYVGATLDINHALASTENTEEFESVLEGWFQELAEYIKVIHLYTPSDVNAHLMDKFTTTLNLAARYSPDTHVFLESKQNSEVTKRVFASLKNKEI